MIQLFDYVLSRLYQIIESNVNKMYLVKGKDFRAWSRLAPGLLRKTNWKFDQDALHFMLYSVWGCNSRLRWSISNYDTDYPFTNTYSLTWDNINTTEVHHFSITLLDQCNWNQQTCNVPTFLLSEFYFIVFLEAWRYQWNAALLAFVSIKSISLVPRNYCNFPT